MRSVVIGCLGLGMSLSMAVSAFGSSSKDVAEGKKVLHQINVTTQFGLSQVNIYKYKIAALCKFVGQLTPLSQRAEKLYDKLQGGADNQALAQNLLKARGIIYVTQVDICTAIKTWGQPQGYDKKTEDSDADNLEVNLRELVRISNAP